MAVSVTGRGSMCSQRTTASGQERRGGTSEWSKGAGHHSEGVNTGRGECVLCA